MTIHLQKYDLAREILGDDFISPEEVTLTRSLTYTHEQLVMFSIRLPTRETLEWCRNNGFMLVAGPPHLMSLLDIMELGGNQFCIKECGWYTKGSETFAQNEKVSCCWLMLSKTIASDATHKIWEEQKQPISVANAVTMIWGVTTYKVVRDIYLFSNLCFTTSSTDSEGNPVKAGFFSEYGLYIMCW